MVRLADHGWGERILYLMSASGQPSTESYSHSDLPKSAGREWDVGTRSETGLPGTVPKTGERVGIIILAVLNPLRAQKWIRHL